MSKAYEWLKELNEKNRQEVAKMEKFYADLAEKRKREQALAIAEGKEVLFPYGWDSSDPKYQDPNDTLYNNPKNETGLI
jgi:transcriptional accessory protein Tex/SPT6